VKKKHIDLEWILLFFLLVLVVSLNKYLQERINTSILFSSLFWFFQQSTEEGRHNGRRWVLLVTMKKVGKVNNNVEFVACWFFIWFFYRVR
jgi:hypothetical protein